MKNETMERIKHPLRTIRDLITRGGAARTLAEPAAEREWTTQLEVRETDDSFVFSVDVPGVRERDLAVSCSGRQLTIGGTRPPPALTKHEAWLAQERGYGTFTHSFTLPESADIDAIQAEVADGVLRLVIPKRTKVQRIPITADHSP